MLRSWSSRRSVSRSGRLRCSRVQAQKEDIAVRLVPLVVPDVPVEQQRVSRLIVEDAVLQMLGHLARQHVDHLEIAVLVQPRRDVLPLLAPVPAQEIGVHLLPVLNPQRGNGHGRRLRHNRRPRQPPLHVHAYPPLLIPV